MNYLPQELAAAKNKAALAWDAYDYALEHFEITTDLYLLLAEATQADRETHDWYIRWQKVGGTSDIESIVAKENERLYQLPAAPVLKQMDGEELGTHTGILGGDVFELGSEKWFNNIKEIPF